MTATALNTVDGTENKGYCKLPPLEEAVAAHLLPPWSYGLKAVACPTKPSRLTWALANKAFAAADQASSALHTMSVLQVFKDELTWDMDESGRNPGAFKELHKATDLALRATKTMLQGVGKAMASLVVLDRHLWLNLMDIRDAEKMAFLDSAVNPKGLFSPAVDSFTKCFTEPISNRPISTPSYRQMGIRILNCLDDWLVLAD